MLILASIWIYKEWYSVQLFVKAYTDTFILICFEPLVYLPNINYFKAGKNRCNIKLDLDMFKVIRLNKLSIWSLKYYQICSRIFHQFYLIYRRNILSKHLMLSNFGVYGQSKVCEIFQYNIELSIKLQ